MDSKTRIMIIVVLGSIFFSFLPVTYAQTSSSFQLTEKTITAGGNSTSSGFKLVSSIDGIIGFMQSSGFQLIAGFLPLTQGGNTIPSGLFSGVTPTIASDGSYTIPTSASSAGTLNFATTYGLTTSGSTASVTLPVAYTFTDSGLGATVLFPSGTQMTADTSSWSGTFSTPTTLSTTLVVAPSGGSASQVIRVGLTNIDFTLSQPIKITFTGKAGQNVAFIDKNGLTTGIPTICNGVDLATVTAQLAGTNGACKINNNADLLVWTKHMSDFFSFTPAPEAAGGAPYYDIDGPSFSQKFGDGEKPLVIGNTIFSKIGYYNQKTETALVKIGTQVPFRLLMFENEGPQNVQHVALYMNLDGAMNTEVHKSDTWIVFDKNKDFEIHDPHGFMSDAYTSTATKGNKFEISFYITFAKPMPKSNLILVAWDTSRNSATSTVLDAFEVTGSEKPKTVTETKPTESNKQIIPSEEMTPEPGVDVVPEPGVDVATSEQKETIQKWAGFHTMSASDSELIKALDIKISSDVDSIPQLPKWTKNNLAKWVLDDKISMREFHDAINYIVKNIKS